MNRQMGDGFTLLGLGRTFTIGFTDTFYAMSWFSADQKMEETGSLEGRLV